MLRPDAQSDEINISLVNAGYGWIKLNIEVDNLSVSVELTETWNDPSQFNRQSVPLKQHNNFVHIERD